MSSSPGWLPPTGGPESPRTTSWSSASPPPSRPTAGWNGSVAGLVVGIVAILVGLAAVGLQNAYKLDAETLLTGGAYIRDEWRLAILLGGLTLAGSGLTLTVVAALTRGPATIILIVVTSTLLAVVLAACIIAIAALANANRERAVIKPVTAVTSSAGWLSGCKPIPDCVAPRRS